MNSPSSSSSNSQSDFTALFSATEKRYFRRCMVCSDSFVSQLDAACLHPPALIQFSRDIITYGLYEACLYTIGYIRHGWYLDSIFDACVAELTEQLYSANIRPRPTLKRRGRPRKIDKLI